MKKTVQEVNIVNRKAKHDYEFLETFVAGIVLVGSEVKSIREGRISLVDSFCYFQAGELWLKGANITPSDKNFVHEPLRDRKLLLNRSELKKLQRGLETGITIVVNRMFTLNGRIKVEISLARGKKAYDKREDIKKKDAQREMQRNLAQD
jgi:SsrA-binding protein